MNPEKNTKAYSFIARYMIPKIEEEIMILGTGGIKRRSLSLGK
jgi:hypothetical protein